MNKRQKKKAYQKIMGINPPAGVEFKGRHFQNILQWGGINAKRQEIRNLEGFNQAMTERRKKCRNRNW